MSERVYPQPPALDPSTVRAVVFDLDGTLVDSYGPITTSVNHARASFGLPPLEQADVRRRVGWGLESLIADVLGTDRVARGVELFRTCYAGVFEEGTHLLPEARATVEELHARGYRLAVASNKPARFSTPILRRLDLLAYFGCVLGPDLAGSTKPEPAMIWQCLERLGVPSGAAMYVGDMLLDVESAARAGVPVVLVAGGSAEIDRLAGTGHLTVDRLGELLRLLP